MRFGDEGGGCNAQTTKALLAKGAKWDARWMLKGGILSLFLRNVDGETPGDYIKDWKGEFGILPLKDCVQYFRGARALRHRQRHHLRAGLARTLKFPGFLFIFNILATLSDIFKADNL